jgi:hypothetical protein
MVNYKHFTIKMKLRVLKIMEQFLEMGLVSHSSLVVLVMKLSSIPFRTYESHYNNEGETEDNINEKKLVMNILY